MGYRPGGAGLSRRPADRDQGDDGLSPSDRLRWGLVSTIKAPVDDILGFAAHHLDLGAHRLYLYLDAENPEAYARLKAHPKVRVQTCDAKYWQKFPNGRPKKHQVRQTLNATHAYARRVEVDWLIHIDVDEFLWPDKKVEHELSTLPDTVQTARVRPIEQLSDAPDLYKAFIPPGPDRARIVEEIYPTFGQYLKGGFLSHVAGKPFVRTGLGDLTVKIHNVFLDDVMNPGEAELAQVDLCHCHAKSWDAWVRTFRYRLSQGSYRAELGPAQPQGVTLHEALSRIEQDQGEAGLHAFFNEVSAATPELLQSLRDRNLLKRRELGLEGKIRKHFPLN